MKNSWRATAGATGMLAAVSAPSVLAQTFIGGTAINPTKPIERSMSSLGLYSAVKNVPAPVQTRVLHNKDTTEDGSYYNPSLRQWTPLFHCNVGNMGVIYTPMDGGLGYFCSPKAPEPVFSVVAQAFLDDVAINPTQPITRSALSLGLTPDVKGVPAVVRIKTVHYKNKMEEGFYYNPTLKQWTGIFTCNAGNMGVTYTPTDGGVGYFCSPKPPEPVFSRAPKVSHRKVPPQALAF